MREAHVTVRTSRLGEHTPVLVERHENGYDQVSDRLEPYTEFDDAKREAVRWSQSLKVPYKVPRG